MNGKILVPLDGSKVAECALPYVENIAVKTDGEIVLLSVSATGSPETNHIFQSYLEHLTEQIERRLKERWNGQKPPQHLEVHSGKAAEEIVRYADENNVSLIVMSSRGLSARGPWALGSVAGKVVRGTRKPVLLVRGQPGNATIQQDRLVKRILVPLDGSPTGESAIPCTGMMAKALDSEVVLFHVVRQPAPWVGLEGGMSYTMSLEEEEGRKAYAIAYLEKVGKQLEDEGVKVTCKIGFGFPADEILDYAKANAVGLIAMSSHGRSGIRRWVLGSVTAKVLNSGDTAVLIVRASKE